MSDTISPSTLIIQSEARAAIEGIATHFDEVTRPAREALERLGRMMRVEQKDTETVDARRTRAANCIIVLPLGSMLKEDLSF